MSDQSRRVLIVAYRTAATAALGLPVQVVTAMHAQRAVVDAIHGAAQSRK